MPVRAVRSLSILLSLFVTCTIAAAQTGYAPQIEEFTPRGGCRGTTVELTFRGTRLDDARDLLFDGSGLRATKVTNTKDGVTATIEIAADAPLGLMPLCLRTEAGLSETVVFDIGSLPEVDEVEPNGEIAKAQLVSSETTVNGTLGSDDDDFYAVDIEAGIDYAFEVEAVRLGGKPCDASIELLSADGASIARSEDTLLGRMDPLLVRRFETKSRIHIVVRRQTAVRNGGEPYRLSIGRFARPLALLPCGGRRGTTSDVEVVGAPGTTKLAFPASNEQVVEWYASNDVGPAPSPLPVFLSDAPGFVERGGAWIDESGVEVPKLESGSPRLPLPSAAYGTLSQPGEGDIVTLAMKKGQVVIARGVARLVRSPVDPVVEVRNTKGRFLGRNDDAGSPDASLRFQAPEDGDYEFTLRDMLGDGGPDHVYVLEFTAPRDVAEVTFVSPRGFQTTSVTVPVGRRAGFALRVRNLRPVEGATFEIEGLPPGVRAEFAPWREGGALIPVMLHADATAAPAAAMCPLRLVVRYGETVDSFAIANTPTLTAVENRRVYTTRRMNVVPVAVGVAPTFEITVAAPRVPLITSSAIELAIELSRTKDTTQAVTIRPLWLPPGVTAGSVRIRGNETTAKLTINAESNAAVGIWPFALTATSDGAGGLPIATAFFDLVIEKPRVTARLGKARMEIGGSAEIALTFDAPASVEGTLRPEILNLPSGVTLEPATIVAGEKQTTLRLMASAEANAGLTKPLLLRLKVPSPDGDIVHQFRFGELRIDEPLEERPAAAPPIDAANSGTVARPKT